MKCIYIIDVDGTLCSRQRDSINTLDCQRILEEKEKGNRIIICTGRSQHEAQHILDQISFDDIFISGNGALTIKGNEIITYYPMNKEQALEIVHYCQQHHIEGYVIRCLKENGNFRELFSHAKEYVPTPNEEFLDFHLYTETSEEKELLIEQLKAIAGNDLVVKNSGEVIIEVFNKNLNKGLTLKYLEENGYLGNGLKVYIGDSDNDLQAIQYIQSIGGIGIAMGNAFDHVKEKVDYVTTDVNDNGVGHAIEWIREKYHL